MHVPWSGGRYGRIFITSRMGAHGKWIMGLLTRQAPCGAPARVRLGVGCAPGRRGERCRIDPVQKDGKPIINVTLIPESGVE